MEANRTERPFPVTVNYYYSRDSDIPTRIIIMMSDHRQACYNLASKGQGPYVGRHTRKMPKPQVGTNAQDYNCAGYPEPCLKIK